MSPRSCDSSFAFTASFRAKMVFFSGVTLKAASPVILAASPVIFAQTPTLAAVVGSGADDGRRARCRGAM
jgi:hypothetical protein